jgi:short-subunit dehydrogenase
MTLRKPCRGSARPEAGRSRGALYQGNVLTPLALVQIVLPTMLEQGEGTIINIFLATAFG